MPSGTSGPRRDGTGPLPLTPDLKRSIDETNFMKRFQKHPSLRRHGAERGCHQPGRQLGDGEPCSLTFMDVVKPIPRALGMLTDGVETEEMQRLLVQDHREKLLAVASDYVERGSKSTCWFPAATRRRKSFVKCSRRSTTWSSKPSTKTRWGTHLRRHLEIAASHLSLPGLAAETRNPRTIRRRCGSGRHGGPEIPCMSNSTGDS